MKYFFHIGGSPISPPVPYHAHLHFTWRLAFLALLGAIAITIGGKIQTPFRPVPMTLHTFVVFSYSALLGPRLGLAAMSIYLGAGAIGLPVFSGSPERGVGLAYMVGPTGGYLFGLLAASGLIGWLAAGRGCMGIVFAMLAGLLVVYAAGLAWLAVFAPFPKLLATGLTPFLLGEFVKIALAVNLVVGVNRLKEFLK